MHVDRDVFKNALDAIIITEAEGSVLEVNPSAIKLLKKRKAFILKQNINYFFNGSLNKKTGEINLIDSDKVFLYAKAPGSAKGTFLYFFRDITHIKEEVREREHFLGIAGHELKNPLATIKALVHLLSRDKVIVKNTKLLEAIKKIDYKADALTKLIRDLLDITKIKQNMLDLSLEKVRFNTVLNNVLEDFAHINKTHKVVVQNQTDIYLNIDPGRTEQVLMNLLKNAAKYSPTNDTIFINIEKRKKYMICEVIDLGIGIPLEEIPKIFNLYYRLPGHEKSFEGLGVGLYIAYQIIKAHKGKMKVKSQVGKGSQFNFYLPINLK